MKTLYSFFCCLTKIIISIYWFLDEEISNYKSGIYAIDDKVNKPKIIIHTYKTILYITLINKN